jgi:putative oxidoreductase
MLSFLDRAQPLGLLVLRLVVGAILIAHGSMKAFGGLHQHMGMVAKLGMPPWMGYLSTTTEFVGGMLLVLGLLTRLVGLAVCIEMVVAIFKVHLKNGLVGAAGYEFPMTIAAVGFALIFFGAGPISLDWLFGNKGGGKR